MIASDLGRTLKLARVHAREVVLKIVCLRILFSILTYTYGNGFKTCGLFCSSFNDIRTKH